MRVATPEQPITQFTDLKSEIGELHPAFLAAPVLIVEDEAVIGWMLESLLEDMGFTSITVVSSGEDAIAASARLTPGLIISDINLGPGRLDGVAAAALIRKKHRAPIIFITGYANSDAMSRVGRALPGSPVLRKPIAMGDLRQTLIDLKA